MTPSRLERTGHLIELGRAIMGARFRWRHPIYLVHAMTARCNARCGFCAWNPDFYDAKDELTTEEVEQLYRDARTAGFVGLSMWGGEPLLRKDFGRLAATAKRLGFTTSIVTNGSLLERKIDEVLPSIDRIGISLDHPSQKHDVIRGVPGLFGKILAAILQIRDRDPQRKIVLNYTLQKANSDLASIERMARLARALGTAVIFNAMRVEPAAVTDGPDLSLHNPSVPEIIAAFQRVRQLKEQGFPIVNSFTHIDAMVHFPPRYRCHWPKMMLPIEANGDVVDCMNWGTRPITNLRETPFDEVLKCARVQELGGEAGEGCHQCVSLHRVAISSAWEGRVEPLISWGRQLL